MYLCVISASRTNYEALQDRVGEERVERFDNDRRRFHFLCARDDHLRVCVIDRSFFGRNLRFNVARGLFPERISRVNHVNDRYVNYQDQIAVSA